MSKSKEPLPEDDDGAEADLALGKAVESYRKAMERDDLTDQQRQEIDERVRAMETREVVERAEKHQPKELASEDKVLIGPPTLTRFEKARITGARALQLSLGAPSFVMITGAKTSLDIAMEELDERVIPIVIRRALPNGDFQNIPIGNFK